MKWIFKDVSITSIKTYDSRERGMYSYDIQIDEIKIKFKEVIWEYTYNNNEKVIGGWNVELQEEIIPMNTVSDFTIHK